MIITIFLEPSITIIAQAIPMFRVMFAKAREARTTADAYRMADGSASNAQSRQRTWSMMGAGKAETRKEPDEELLNVRTKRTAQLSMISASGASEDEGDAVYAGGRPATKDW